MGVQLVSGPYPLVRKLPLVLPPHRVAHLGEYLDKLVVALIMFPTYPVK